MESHIGVSVTILTSDYDSHNGSPTKEIAKILLVRILCIELVGWNILVEKMLNPILSICVWLVSPLMAVS